MILTGPAIREAVANGEITIDPFNAEQVNPNSYNYRLGDEIYSVEPNPDGGMDGALRLIEPSGGRVLLRKGRLYLGHTSERLGSTRFVTSLIGRSSIGRLGLFVQLSADLGHCGDVHRWTLELLPTLDIYVYPGQIIGQVSFWSSVGSVSDYRGWYGRHDAPMLSKLHMNLTHHPEIRGHP
jgi:dCTP deaminase